MKLQDWVKAARTHKGMTQEQLGDELGLTKGNISGWENGRHEPGYYQLLKIQEITGYKLTPELDPASDFEVIDMPSFSRSGAGVIDGRQRMMSVAAYPSMQPILSWQHEDDLPPGDYVMIPALNVHLGAGAGKDQVEIELTETTPLAFRSDWIRKMHLKPKKLAAMTARGRSMEPSIWDGDSLVVDISQNEVNDGQVYALWYDGGERVKRLYRLPGGGLRIKSDNPEHGVIELGPDYAGHVRIIGRVVHRSGSGGL